MDLKRVAILKLGKTGEPPRDPVIKSQAKAPEKEDKKDAITVRVCIYAKYIDEELTTKIANDLLQKKRGPRESGLSPSQGGAQKRTARASWPTRPMPPARRRS